MTLFSVAIAIIIENKEDSLENLMFGVQSADIQLDTLVILRALFHRQSLYGIGIDIIASV